MAQLGQAALIFPQFGGPDTILRVQREMISILASQQPHWISRIQDEAEIAARTCLRLMSSRSVPATTTALKEWLEYRKEKFLADADVLAEANRRVLGALTPLWTSSPSLQPEPNSDTKMPKEKQGGEANEKGERSKLRSRSAT